MDRPTCSQAIGDSEAACGSCGQDARVTTQASEGRVYGPYTMPQPGFHFREKRSTTRAAAPRQGDPGT